MLDDNLPTFFLKGSTNGLKHHLQFHLSHHGSDPAPAYLLQHADPASPAPAHKNCYAAALFDAYNPEVLFGEVLARPGWTQPTLSAEEVKRNGGVPPPPQPVLPSGFTVQLYNPDQQIRVELREGKWGGSDSYEFSMPISTFRTPSASTLDRGQSDPASLAITPKVHFVWRRESKLSKDLTCFMTGKSTDAHEKKKSRRDPDIAIALWRSMRELTVYEPNLQRVEMEDPKGLEVVLLVSAVVIKDLYMGGKDHLLELFNISDVPSERKLSGGGRKLSNPNHVVSIHGVPNPLHLHPPGSPPPGTVNKIRPSPNEAKRNSLPRLQTTSPPTRQQRPPPVPDPRAQWELEAETARLKAQAETEAREQQRIRLAREKADEQERRRLQKMVEEEEKEARRHQAEIDKETERLRKMYGVQPLPSETRQQQQQQQQQQANSSSSRQHVHFAGAGPQINRVPQPRPSLGSHGLYIQPSGGSSSLTMSGANGNASSMNLGVQQAKKKKSFFGLRSEGEAQQQQGGGKKLNKKGSAVW